MDWSFTKKMASLHAEKESKAEIPNEHLQHRNDIDGLRAIAVIAVVLFHAFPSLIKGGFIGVDIFFVISGFLISSILMRELRDGSFSVAHFYSRRIIRIFPALITVLIACLTFGWIALLADEYKSLAKHSLAGAGFISNFISWSETSYFDVGAEAKPLLHLWSLGVEEQFYLVWPLLLLALWRTRDKLPFIIVVMIAISFGFNLFQVVQNPTADFYSPQTRFWELLIGALIASLRGLWKKSSVIIHTLSCGGAAVIVAGLFLISSTDDFPGGLAMIPVAGSAMLIVAGPQGLFNRTLLSSRLMVAVGLISYPLYLWHWPLLVFPRIIDSTTPSFEVRITAVALAVVFAWGTYRFIETPIRTKRISRSASIKTLCILMTFTAVSALAIFNGDGFKFRKGANPVERYWRI